MNRLLLLALAAFGLSTAALAASPQQPKGDATAGKDKVAVCTACHNSDGNSAVGMYPKLAGLGERYLFKQLRDIQSDERPVPEMTGMLTGLDDQDLADIARSEEHTSELQSRGHLVCRLLLEKNK